MIEVFNEVSNRMVRNIMKHEQMADYFDFLNLHGLKRWHEYQFFEESAELRGIHRYAINHCNRIIRDENIESVQAIPMSWYGYTRMQVDSSTRKNAVKDALEKWLDWEKESKELYERVFKQLTDNNKIAEADKINELILDVDKEIKLVTRKMLEYKAVDYDMEYILLQQDEMHEEYRKKTKEIGIDIC